MYVDGFMLIHVVYPYGLVCVICDACCVVCVLSLICTRMTGVGGRPELIIEGTNNLESDQWMVSAIQLPRTSSNCYIYLHVIIILNTRYPGKYATLTNSGLQLIHQSISLMHIMQILVIE